MSINKKILNHIKRKVNENRLRDKVSDILDNTLPSIIREVKRGPSPKQLQTKHAEEFVDQVDQEAALDDTVTEAGNHLQNKVYDAVTGMSINGKDSFEGKFAIKRGKLNDFIFKLSDRDARGILKLIKQRKFEGKLTELDVRKTHGNKRIKNAATGNNIKLRTALKAKKGSAVYAKGKAMYNALKDTPANESKLKERAYASTDGKPTFDYDPGEGKLTEAEDYKYKKYVAKAFKDILGAQFDFRHAMGVKQLTNKDMKLKKKADAIYKAIIDLQKDMKSKGLTEASRKELGMSSSVSKRRAGAELKQKLAGKRSDGMGKYTATIYGMNGSKRVELKSLNDLNKFSKFELDEGKLTEASRVSFRDAGISNLMDLKNATDSLTKSNINWDQKGQALVFRNANDTKKAKQILGIKEGKLTEVKIGDMVKIDKAYGGGKGKVEDKKGSFIVVNGSSYHETDVKVVNESNLTEAKLRKGDLVGVDDEIGVVNKVKGRVAYIKLPSMPRSFHPIEVERAKYKGKFKGKDLYISEGKLTEAKDQKLAKLFQASKLANVKMGEDKLYKLSQAWERWNVDNDDKYDNLVDPLFAAIELVQDAGQPGKNNVVKDKEYYSYIKSADKHLKQFNKDVIKAMKEHK